MKQTGYSYEVKMELIDLQRHHLASSKVMYIIEQLDCFKVLWCLEHLQAQVITARHLRDRMKVIDL